MPIKNLQKISTLPQDIKEKIEVVLQTRNNVSRFPLLKGNEYIWGIWDYSNRDFTTWCAKLIVSYFFLSYMQLLEQFLEKKYSNISKIEIDRDKDLDINIQQIQANFQGKINKDDYEWINQDILMPIARAITCVTSDYITSLNDLVALSNLGNKQLDILNKYPEQGDEKEYQLRESLLTYIDNLISAKFIDPNQWKIQSLEKVKSFRLYGEMPQEKVGIEVTIGQSEQMPQKLEYKDTIKGISMSEEIPNSISN
jgi:hypothetical protein